MRIAVTRIGGGIEPTRRAEIDTAARPDAPTWEALVAAAEIDLRRPPPYRAVPREAVFHIRCGQLSVVMAESDLTDALHDLVDRAMTDGLRDADG